MNLFNKRFTTTTFFGSEVNIHYLENHNAGKPPLVLLHGYPQTHMMWHQVANILCDDFYLVIPDLRGYGDSSKPKEAENHESYSKRAMARDIYELMMSLGIEKFAVAGHDRGARVTHRFCLDYPQHVTHACVMDIIPTRYALETTDLESAQVYYHWFFLSQPAPFPENMISANPEVFLRNCLTTWSKGNNTAFNERALNDYIRCFDDTTIHTTCEDYRAAVTIDLEHDRTDERKRVSCKLLALWGARGFVGRKYDVVSIWADHAEQVEGQALDCAHFLPEEKPDETARCLSEFLLSN